MKKKYLVLVLILIVILIMSIILLSNNILDKDDNSISIADTNTVDNDYFKQFYNKKAVANLATAFCFIKKQRPK